MRGNGGSADAVSDAEEFGFPEEIVAAIAAAGAEREVEVWRENWDIVCAFAAVITQWNVVQIAPGRVHYLGLDYAAVRAGLEAEEIAVTPELWRGLRVMEAEACNELNGAG